MARFSNPFIQYLNGSAQVLDGNQLFFYEPGTTTPKDTYSDTGFTTVNPNPVIANGDGYVPNIELDGTYKCVLKDKYGVTVPNGTADPIGDTSGGQLEQWLNDNTYNIPDMVVGSDDQFYKSLVDANQGNDPVSNPSEWELMLLGGSKTTIIAASDPAWAYTVGVKAAIVTAIGAGAGAGGIDGQGAGTAAASRAGTGGGFSIKTVEAPTGTLAIVIGAAGTGGAAGDNDGSDGGDTTVIGTGISITGNGGNLGAGNTGTAGSSIGAATAGGESSGGDVNGKGVCSGMRAIVSGDVANGSISGFCPVTGGGVPVQITGNGITATIPGEGGGAIAESDTTANRAGGDGFRGEVQITEFF
tara:strand:+ start:33857 stop:34930 length:1074 start_codon:yes stop_codon:yes gene_type:complete